MQEEENLINNHTDKKLIFKKINYSYLVIFFFIIANLILNIILICYLSEIINFVKDKVDEIESEDLVSYIHKFKYIVDYFCKDLVKCE